MTDFSVPKRMSPGAFVIIFLNISKSVFNLFWLFAISYFVTGDFNLADGALTRTFEVGGACVLFAIAVALAMYLSQSFYIGNGNLIFKHGLLRREVTNIPLGRIHALRTKRSLFYRILGLRGIAFDTLATKAEEIELILDEQDWRSLMRYIEAGEHSPEEAGAEEALPPLSTKRFSNLDILRDAICQNHLKGTAILFGILYLIFDKITDVAPNAIDKIADIATGYVEHNTITPFGVTLVIVAVYFTVLLLWVAKVMLRYFNLTLTYDSRLLTFSHGLLARMSSRFACNKICTVWVKRNIPERCMKLNTVILRQALNVTAYKEEDNLKIYGTKEPEFFLRWWLGQGYADSPEVVSARSGRGVLVRVLVPDLILSGAVSALLCHFERYEYIIIQALYLLVSAVKGICAMRRSRITLRESHVEVYNGKLADICNYLKYENIEVVAIHSTPFTRWLRRVTLRLSTPGTNFSIRSLNQTEAERIREYLLNAVISQTQE